MSRYTEWYQSQTGVIHCGPIKNSAWQYQQEIIDRQTAEIEQLQARLKVLQDCVEDGGSDDRGRVIDLDYGENGAAEALWGDEVKSCN